MKKYGIMNDSRLVIGIMFNFFKRHFHPLGGRIIFWNLVLLIAIKLVLPQSAFQWASLLENLPVFDSRDVIKITNDFRTQNNLPVLKANYKLDLAASEKLNDMAVKEYFAHTSPAGVTPWFWIKGSQYQYSVAGENLAIGFITADDTVRAWMNSPSHKANLLNTNYQDIGVAVKGVSINGRQGVLVVQMFGKPSTAKVAAVNPTPTPVKTAPVPKPTTVAIPETKGETIALTQSHSTDANVAPVEKPVSVPVKVSEDVATAVNNIYSVYSMLIAVISVSAFFLYERSRQMAFKTVVHISLFALAIIIPIAQASLSGLIF
jgi:hypothetical protein